MFFSKHKQIGCNLSKFAIGLCEDQIKSISQLCKQFSEIEILRLKVCFYVFDLITIQWWIHRFERNRENQKRIIENLFENFLNAINNRSLLGTSIVRLLDFIVDSDEIVFIENQSGGKVSEYTEYSANILIDELCIIRLDQYISALNKYMETPGKTTDFFANLFIKHFTGEKLDDFIEGDGCFYLPLSLILPLPLSLILPQTVIDTGKAVKTVLGIK